MNQEKAVKERGFYAWVERVGNKIPSPAAMFIFLFFLTYALSIILSLLKVTATNPATGEAVSVVNLFTSSYIGGFLRDVNKTWFTFAPMVTVPICTVGLAVATRSGLLESTLKTASGYKNQFIMTLIVTFIGINANVCGDAAFLVFPPLVAILFKSVKRNPLAGLFLGYASVSVGFAACVLLASSDATLAGLTEAAAQTIDPSYTCNATMGWYFMFFSAIVLTFVVTLIDLKLVEPRLARSGLAADAIAAEGEEYKGLDATQKKGLKGALIALIGVFVVIALLCLPGMPFAAPEGKRLTQGLLFKSIPTVICIMFFVPGYVYGKITGSIHKLKDTVPMITAELKTLSGFFVVCLFASLFMQAFGDSNIASIIAIGCGNFISGLGVPKVILIALFVIVIAFINLFMPSASAKWSLLAGMFVPMLMIAGISPAATQVAYRMGDSVTNNLAPTFAYLAVILEYAQDYDSRAKTGTMMSYMITYSWITALIWIALLVGWILLGLPLGPGTTAFL